MKTPVLLSLLTTIATTGAALADVPRAAPVSRYSKLWTDSPFTTPPPPPDPTGPENPMTDYALIGVSPLGNDKYRATILNKKKPDEPRIYLETGREISGFKLVSVKRRNGDPLATTVQVQAGSRTGTISVDEKVLTLAAPPAPKQVAPQPGQQIPGQPPGQANPMQPGQGRQPRPRTIPPPTTGGQAAAPQPQQQVQQAPQPQLQQQQQQHQTNGGGGQRGERIQRRSR